MQKISFTNLSPDAQKTAIMEAFRSVWYLDTVLNSLEMDVHGVVCEHFDLPYYILKVNPVLGAYGWSLDDSFIVPSVKVRLQSNDEDDLEYFVRRQLLDRVQFYIDERDIVGIDAVSVDGFSFARIESTVHMKEKDRVVLEDMVAGLVRSIERYATEYVEEKAKGYYSDDAIRAYLEEVDMDYTEDGRLICEYDERK